MFKNVKENVNIMKEGIKGKNLKDPNGPSINKNTQFKIKFTLDGIKKKIKK